MLNLNLDDIDIQDTATWPLILKIIAVAALVFITVWLSQWLFIDSKRKDLGLLLSEESRTKTFFVSKQKLLVNINEYKKQMDQIEDRLSDVVKLLPSDNELPNLVNQISAAGKQSGLVFKEITILPEKKLKYYVELPIKIKVYGGYHQLGEFISESSDLERVITFHDFKLKNLNEQDKSEIDEKQLKTNHEHLELEILAKTYRYITSDTENTDGENKSDNKKK